MTLKTAYQNFFLKTDEGKEFLKTLGKLIDTAHEKAEKSAEEARDFTQQAKGVRQVVEHIQSVTTEIKGNIIK